MHPFHRSRRHQNQQMKRNEMNEINEMNEMVKDRGFGAIGPLMGVVMKKLGGTADGKLVNKLLKSKIEDLIE